MATPPPCFCMLKAMLDDSCRGRERHLKHANLILRCNLNMEGNFDMDNYAQSRYQQIHSHASMYLAWSSGNASVAIEQLYQAASEGAKGYRDHSAGLGKALSRGSEEDFSAKNFLVSVFGSLHRAGWSKESLRKTPSHSEEAKFFTTLQFRLVPLFSEEHGVTRE